MSRTRVPIEAKKSVRWLENLKQAIELFGEPFPCGYSGDRESDIYELFCAAQENGSNLLMRTCIDRLASDHKHTISAAMRHTKARASHQVEDRHAKGTVSEAMVNVKYLRLQVYPPIGKQKQYPSFILSAIHASESSAPGGRARSIGS